MGVAVLHKFDDLRSASGEPTILRRDSGQPLVAEYESRNVFIVSLPEILLVRMWTCTAAEVYAQWLQCETIIGKRPRCGY